jgi:uncharacterized membrane protein HdeD (DUF308 family)
MFLGVLLIVLGLLTYVLSQMASWTPLIPAIFGVVFLILGVIAQVDSSKRKHSMHIAVIFTLLGLLGSLGALGTLPALLSGQEVARPMAVFSRSVMAMLLLVYFGLSIKSFITARRASRG